MRINASKKTTTLLLCALLFIVWGILFTFIADSLPIPPFVYWCILGGSGLLFALVAWWQGRADLAPDFLSQFTGRFFEQKGLCFAFAPQIENSLCRLVVCYQNRYNRPCDAVVTLQESDGALSFEYRHQIQIKFACPAGAYGEASKPWNIPARYRGSEITFRVGADVYYPQGKGSLLRFRPGTGVGSASGKFERAIGMLTLLTLLTGHIAIHRGARLTIRMPAGLPPPLQPQTEEPVRNEVFWKYGDATMLASIRADSANG